MKNTILTVQDIVKYWPNDSVKLSEQDKRDFLMVLRWEKEQAKKGYRISN
jgi:hypothetical protein